MPSQERFRARPMWACLEPCPASQNYQFWIGQQPNPQICFSFCSNKIFRKYKLNQKPVSSAIRIFARKKAKIGGKGNLRRWRVRERGSDVWPEVRSGEPWFVGFGASRKAHLRSADGQRSDSKQGRRECGSFAERRLRAAGSEAGAKVAAFSRGK